MLAANGRNANGHCGCPICSGTNGGGRALSNTGTTETWSLERAVGQLTSLPTWAGAGRGTVTITYSFPTSAADVSSDYSPNSDEIRGFRAYSAAQQDAARRALALWQDVADVRFVEAQGGQGAIRFSNHTARNDYNAYARPPGAGAGGDVWTNPNYFENSRLGIGQYGYLTMVHEIGHTLGLNHSNNYNGTRPQTNPTHTYDSHQYSVMSYYNHQAGENAGALPAAPMLLDILAIQRIYGANTTTRTGNTTYGFNATQDVRAEFNFAVNQRPIVAIWDAGGVDTLDLSGYGANQVIDLRAGSYSSVGGLRNNLAIAVGATVENAVGGAGNDVVAGNEANNRLRGGGGNDRYVIFGRSFGRDVIDDAQGQSQVVFNDLRSGDVRMTRQGNDLTVATVDGSSSVLLRNYYTAGGSQAYRLAFADGGTPPTPTDPDPQPPTRPQPRDAGDSLATALDLGTFNGPTTNVVRGGVGGSDRADVFRFRVLSGQRTSVTLSGMSADADLFVYNASGRLLAQSVNGGTLPDRVAGSIGAGTYYVAVIPYNGATTSYQLTIATGGAAARRNVARQLEGGTARPVSGGRHSLALRDHTSLNVEARASLDPVNRRERDRHGQIAVGG